MRILYFSLLAGASIFSASHAHAEASWSGNINLVSEYRFRGIDQTWGQPALQGGVDWNHTDGWYAGASASNVSSRSYPGGSSEIDLYGGFNGKINEDWSYTVGAYGYIYPGANLRHARCPSASFSAPCAAALPSQSYNTLEINAGLGWRWLAYKMSVSATDYFGANQNTGYNRSTRGSVYHDLTATMPLTDSVSLAVHGGYTDIRADTGGYSPNYADWRIALSKRWQDGWNAAVGVVGASNNRFYRPPAGGLSAMDMKTRDLNRPVFIVQIGKAF